ncbi:CehA/McbA family metallohydrolase [Sinimarinibacterium flocculans]|uniref:Putative metal-dependent phosphoesterase TrpH n=1 Tax=Sinimarinibacterium flocculans TaxID=985250 RepID=A0A318E2T9_9GAMM|nr:CehA/McbA family metallohydrolase [Sinimarinibacterium flocculans]PXV64275.1 putative metal-dependent phosphoesterase TrpH [Sinimarinibacterium flocculans]
MIPTRTATGGTRRAVWQALTILLGIWAAPAYSAEALPHHGWILTQNDTDYNRAVIARMREYAVTHAQLSHRIVTRVDQFDDPEVVARVRLLADDIHAQGAKVLVWAQELGEDRLSFCFDPDGADMRARMQRYRDALTQIPAIDGVVISFGSAPSELSTVVPSCQPAQYARIAERYKAMIEAVSRVVSDEFGKDVYVRTFYHKGLEIPFLRAALAETQRPITVMTKSEPNDFAPYYPLNPLVADVGAHPQFLELDCAGEYWGRSTIPFVAAEYFAQRYRETREQFAAGSEGRFIGSACRVDRYEHPALGTLNEANIDAQARLVQNPDTDWREILARFVSTRFGLAPGSAATTELVEILRRTYWIGRKMYYAKGDWAFKKGSTLPDSGTDALTLLLDKNIAQWNADYRSVTQQLLTPNRQTLLELLQEKREAVDLAERNLQALAGLRENLDAAAYAQLETLLLKQRLATEIWLHMTGAIFGLRHNSSHLESAARPWVPWHLGELERLAAALENGDYPQISDPYPFPPGDIRRLIANTRDPLLQFGPGSPPQWLAIDGIDIVETGPDSVTVGWQARAGLRYQVELTQTLPHYPQTYAPDSAITADGPVSLRIADLQPGTPYAVRVRAEADGQSMVSGDYPFWTRQTATAGGDAPSTRSGGGAMPAAALPLMLLLALWRRYAGRRVVGGRLLLSAGLAAGLSACGGSEGAAADGGPPPEPTVLRLEGSVGSAGDTLYLPFELPAGVQRLDATLSEDSPGNLGLGVFDARGADFGSPGFRGISGAERREVFIADDAATPGFIAGPLAPGPWTLAIPNFLATGKARVEVKLSFGSSAAGAALLPAQELARNTPGWYFGDLHVHTVHSSDAFSSGAALEPAQMAERAQAHGLDFLSLTDHNVTTQNDRLSAAAPPGFLLLGGEEVTTWMSGPGHLTVTGLQSGDWVDWRFRPSLGVFADTAAWSAYDRPVQVVLEQARALGLYSAVAHPMIWPGFGSNWGFFADAETDPAALPDGFEVWNGSADFALTWGPAALRRWDEELARGRHVCGNGGSDVHGVGGEVEVGRPATVVYAPALSRAAITAALRGCRGYMTADPDGPALMLSGAGPDGQQQLVGGTLYGSPGDSVTLSARVTGGEGAVLIWIHNGRSAGRVTLGAADQTVSQDFGIGEGGAVRAELRASALAGEPLALSNPIFLRLGAASSGGDESALIGQAAALLPGASPQ